VRVRVRHRRWLLSYLGPDAYTEPLASGPSVLLAYRHTGISVSHQPPSRLHHNEFAAKQSKDGVWVSAAERGTGMMAHSVKMWLSFHRTIQYSVRPSRAPEMPRTTGVLSNSLQASQVLEDREVSAAPSHHSRPAVKAPPFLLHGGSL
jgi:hypothetical protein